MLKKQNYEDKINEKEQNNENYFKKSQCRPLSNGVMKN